MSASFADWVRLKKRLPSTSWGDFLRLALQAGELDRVGSFADLKQLVVDRRSEDMSTAKADWSIFRKWAITNGHPDPQGSSLPLKPGARAEKAQS